MCRQYVNIFCTYYILRDIQWEEVAIARGYSLVKDEEEDLAVGGVDEVTSICDPF